MIRARFYIKKSDCDNDHRPVKWPIKYPYWCSAESSNSFVLVAYAEDEDNGLRIFASNPACYIIMFFTTFVKESFQVTI